MDGKAKMSRVSRTSLFDKVLEQQKVRQAQRDSVPDFLDSVKAELKRLFIVELKLDELGIPVILAGGWFAYAFELLQIGSCPWDTDLDFFCQSNTDKDKLHTHLLSTLESKEGSIITDSQGNPVTLHAMPYRSIQAASFVLTDAEKDKLSFNTDDRCGRIERIQVIERIGTPREIVEKFDYVHCTLAAVYDPTSKEIKLVTYNRNTMLALVEKRLIRNVDKSHVIEASRKTKWIQRGYVI